MELFLELNYSTSKYTIIFESNHTAFIVLKIYFLSFMTLKLILHPGYNKCGSTSIQRYIHLNAETIEQQGFYISDINFRFTFDTPKILVRRASPFFYFERMMESQDFSNFQKRVESVVKKAERRGSKGIVISSEGLGNNEGRRRGVNIHKILSSYFNDVTVLIYIRRQDDYLLSSWQQWGHRLGENLDDHVSQALASSEYSPMYLETAKYFGELYGEANVQVLPLVRGGLIKGDLGIDFCSRSGIDVSNLKDVGAHVNKGLNPYICDILSRSSNVYEHVHDNSVKALLESYGENESLLFRKDKLFLSPDSRMSIMKHYESENISLHSKYFKQLLYDDVFGISNNTLVASNNLSDDMNALKDIAALQMEMLLKILKERSERELSLKKRVRRLIYSIAEFLYQ